MTDTNWHPLTSFEIFIFDCDGTLSSVEGIDELAEENGVGATVKSLTQKAMGETGLTHQLYSQRLALVKPTRDQVLALGEEYYARRAPDIAPVIQLLLHLGKKIFVVSAGIELAVKTFAKQLGLPSENIFAVPVNFDAAGNYVDFDYECPLIRNSGKREIVAHLKGGNKKILYVGDGLNDLAVKDLVARFVGYGGAYHHEKVAADSPYYITTPSMAALLPLGLVPSEVAILNTTQENLYQRGVTDIDDKQVIIR